MSVFGIRNAGESRATEEIVLADQTAAANTIQRSWGSGRADPQPSRLGRHHDPQWKDRRKRINHKL